MKIKESNHDLHQHFARNQQTKRQMNRTLLPQKLTEQSTSLTFKYSRFITQFIQKQQFYLFLEVERKRPKAIKSVNRLIARLKRPFFLAILCEEPHSCSFLDKREVTICSRDLGAFLRWPIRCLADGCGSPEVYIYFLLWDSRIFNVAKMLLLYRQVCILYRSK